jgi:hypothetical protein
MANATNPEKKTEEIRQHSKDGKLRAFYVKTTAYPKRNS